MVDMIWRRISKKAVLLFDIANLLTKEQFNVQIRFVLLYFVYQVNELHLGA